MDNDRHSKAIEAELVTEPDERARVEARNGLRQFDAVIERIGYFLQPGYCFKLRPSLLLDLHRFALEGISSYAGNFRPAGISIEGSTHVPVRAHLVPAEIETLCDYVNDSWASKSAIHLAAYILWRLNWIHPFTDGNGRTSRALSYLVLCVRLGYVLPGTRTIPEQIANDKTLYYQALGAADVAEKKGTVDVSLLEDLLATLLAEQLYAVHQRALSPSDLR